MLETFQGQTQRVLSASAVVKNRPGRLARLHISGGVPTFVQVLDGNVIGSGTVVYQAPATLSGGETLELSIPCRTGIVVMMGSGGVTVVYS